MPVRDTTACEAAREEQSPATTFQIGEVARQVDLSIRTIRHWEEMGLLTPCGRSAGGFRLYSPDDVARLKLLRFMKPLALTLEQTRELMEIRDRLARGATDDTDRADALVWPRGTEPDPDRDELASRLAAIVEGAERRLDKLRRQVVEVEQFIGRLRREVSAGTSRAGQAPAHGGGEITE